MSYLDDVEKELRSILYDTPSEFTDDRVVNFVRTKLLESYKHGAQAARKQMGKGQPKPK